MNEAKRYDVVVKQNRGKIRLNFWAYYADIILKVYYAYDLEGFPMRIGNNSGFDMAALLKLQNNRNVRTNTSRANANAQSQQAQAQSNRPSLVEYAASRGIIMRILRPSLERAGKNMILLIIAFGIVLVTNPIIVEAAYPNLFTEHFAEESSESNLRCVESILALLEQSLNERGLGIDRSDNLEIHGVARYHIVGVSSTEPIAIYTESDVDLLLEFIQSSPVGVTWEINIIYSIIESGLYEYFLEGLRRIFQYNRIQYLTYISTTYTLNELVEMGYFLRPGMLIELQELGFFMDAPEKYHELIIRATLVSMLDGTPFTVEFNGTNSTIISFVSFDPSTPPPLGHNINPDLIRLTTRHNQNESDFWELVSINAKLAEMFFGLSLPK